MKKVFLMIIAVATISLVSCNKQAASSAEASAESSEASADTVQKLTTIKSPLELKLVSTSAAKYFSTVKPILEPIVVTAGAEEGDSVAVEVVVQFKSGNEPKTFKAIKCWDLEVGYRDGDNSVRLPELKCVDTDVLIELAADKAEGAVKPVKFTGKWGKAEYIASENAEKHFVCINNQEVEE